MHSSAQYGTAIYGDATYSDVVSSFGDSGCGDYQVKTVKDSSVKKSQRENVEDIVRKAFADMEKVDIDDDIVETVKSEIKQEIKQIDLSQYDAALDQVRALLLMAENRVRILDEIRADDEDESALLMLM